MKNNFVLIFISTLLALLKCSTSFPTVEQNETQNEDPAVTRLRTFLRFKTEHPNPEDGYMQSIEWLKTQADEIGLTFKVVDLEKPNLFAICMTWQGTDPSLKSILLNSHLDVVPADPAKWLHPPYAAYKDSNGNIFARGASDMKSRTIAHLEAIRKMKQMKVQPLRTIHVTVLPDEEVGSERGMKPFVQTDFFKNLNIGLDLDEGGYLNSSSSTMHVIIAEKNAWKFNVTVKGKATHGSLLPNITAPQRLQTVINRLMSFRKSQYEKFVNAGYSLDEVSTINLVRLGGGIADNVIPDEVWASFDMRILQQPDFNFTHVDDMLDEIIKEANQGSLNPNETVSITFLIKSLEDGRTPADKSNPWWNVLQNTCEMMKLSCRPKILSAASDARFVRDLGIPVFGLAPFPLGRAHEDNEVVNEKDFLKAIEMYTEFITEFSMQPRDIAE